MYGCNLYLLPTTERLSGKPGSVHVWFVVRASWRNRLIYFTNLRQASVAICSTVRNRAQLNPPKLRQWLLSTQSCPGCQSLASPQPRARRSRWFRPQNDRPSSSFRTTVMLGAIASDCLDAFSNVVTPVVAQPDSSISSVTKRMVRISTCLDRNGSANGSKPFVWEFNDSRGAVPLLCGRFAWPASTRLFHRCFLR
jgi:hypothetical protein